MLGFVTHLQVSGSIPIGIVYAGAVPCTVASFQTSLHRGWFSEKTVFYYGWWSLLSLKG